MLAVNRQRSDFQLPIGSDCSTDRSVTRSHCRYMCGASQTLVQSSISTMAPLLSWHLERSKIRDVSEQVTSAGRLCAQVDSVIEWHRASAQGFYYRTHTINTCKIYLASLHVYLAVANSDVAALGVAKMSRSSSPERPVFVAHPLCPPHLRTAAEDAVESLIVPDYCHHSTAKSF